MKPDQLPVVPPPTAPAAASFGRRCAVFLAFVVLYGFSVAGTAWMSESDGEAAESTKPFEARLEHGLNLPTVAPARHKSLNHFVDCGHDRASHPPVPPAGHFLANGLRAPLRC